MPDATACTRSISGHRWIIQSVNHRGSQVVACECGCTRMRFPEELAAMTPLDKATVMMRGTTPWSEALVDQYATLYDRIVSGEQGSHCEGCVGKLASTDPEVWPYCSVACRNADLKRWMTAESVALCEYDEGDPSARWALQSRRDPHRNPSTAVMP